MDARPLQKTITRVSDQHFPHWTLKWITRVRNACVHHTITIVYSLSSLRAGMCEICRLCALMHVNRLSTFRRQELRGWALLESGSFSPHRLPPNCQLRMHQRDTIISKRPCFIRLGDWKGDYERIKLLKGLKNQAFSFKIYCINYLLDGVWTLLKRRTFEKFNLM